MVRKLFLLAFTAAPFLLFAQAPKKLPLDGQKYTAEITEDGKKKPLDPDDLSFNAGKFKSVVFADWGFTKAMKYEVTGIDSTTTPGVKVYSWIVDLTNDAEEKLAWSGTTNGDDIEGTIEYVNKKGQTKKTYNFTGKNKAKKKPVQK
jgi:hypothetical protein